MTNFRKSLSLVLFFFVSILICTTVQAANISGKIIAKESNEPIAFASVKLLSADSVFIKGVNTDDNGAFSLSANNGKYFLSVSYMGYETHDIPVNHNSSTTLLNDIILQPSAIALDNVTITAASIIQKADRKLIMPSIKQIETSTSGLDLLKRMMLNRITVDDINRKVTTSGNKDVQLRINGVEVSTDEVGALRAEDILRIEYHENPGLRYNGAVAVLDYITRRKESGGNVFGNFNNAANGLNDNVISAKYNNKKSEFGLFAYWRYRNTNVMHETEKTYNFPGNIINRKEDGDEIKFKQNRPVVSLNYNLMEKDNYFFNATAKFTHHYMPNGFNDGKGKVYENEVLMGEFSDHSVFKQSVPSLDLYFQKNLKNNQLLIVNAVGTYMSSKNSRTYWEKNFTKDTTFFSEEKVDKYSLILEGIYEKTFNNEHRLSAGLKHTQGYTHNQYLGDFAGQNNLRNAETHAYLEYALNKKKINYVFGIGFARTEHRGSDTTAVRWVPRPTLRISYTPIEDLSIRYHGYVSSYSPALSDLASNQINIDPYNIQRGNSALKAVPFISNELTVSYKKGIFNVDYYSQLSRDFDPIFENLTIEGDKIIHQKANQKSMLRWNNELTVKAQLIKDHLSVNLTPGINYYRNKGDNFDHSVTKNYWRGDIDANYKNFVFNANFYTYYYFLDGQDLYTGEKWHSIAVKYNKPRYSIGLSLMNPFSDTYKNTRYNLSDVLPSTTTLFTNTFSRAIMLNFSFNLNYGRQYQASNKRMNNEDKDSGTRGGK